MIFPKTTADTVFERCTTSADTDAALRLLHDQYVASGFMRPHPSGKRVTPYHQIPDTAVLIARRNGEVVGTLSIIPDGPLGLPMDEAFDLSKLRTSEDKIVEISSLAVRAEDILFPLLKFMYEFCTAQGFHRLIIAVHPDRVRFFQTVLKFLRLPDAEVGRYDFVGGAPATGLGIDLRDWRAQGMAYPDRFYRYFSAGPAGL